MDRNRLLEALIMSSCETNEGGEEAVEGVG